MVAPSTAKSWSQSTAALVVDELIAQGIVAKDHLERAVSIAAEEISVRLALGDLPPPQKENADEGP
jgi:hypothetical protein